MSLLRSTGHDTRPELPRRAGDDKRSILFASGTSVPWLWDNLNSFCHPYTAKTNE